jgi:hypothetical protein
MSARHVGGSPRFVNEDELLGIEVQLVVEPTLALLQDVGAALLYRMASLFYASGRAGRGNGARPTC